MSLFIQKVAIESFPPKQIIQQLLFHSAPEVNSIYECKNTGQLIDFYYATMGYPVISMWIKAIDKGYFQGWRGLTSDHVRCFIKSSKQCEQGHMDQRRQGIHSTKSSHANPPSNTINTMEEPEQAPQKNKTNIVFMTITKAEGQLFSDQTGRFASHPTKTTTTLCFSTLLMPTSSSPTPSSLTTKPNFSRHTTKSISSSESDDNKTSKNVADFITVQNAKHQYTPRDMHRTNIAQRMICTLKNHMCAALAGTPKTYYLSDWCRDLEQVHITLNMMHPCTQNPNLSAYEAMEGMFSFNATPMAPIGTECMIHVKLSKGHIWGYHSMKAWYFALALKHYRCIKVVTDAGAVRITDTFKF
ncbi:hypothetical protein ACHAW6_002618 [Cyclotella cf. meneghiniana]